MLPGDEINIVSGKAEDINQILLENIRLTYNNYIEKVNADPKWTINMSQYCKDVHFLLWLVNQLSGAVTTLKEGGSEKLSIRKEPLQDDQDS